jgi:hypothetical protein
MELKHCGKCICCNEALAREDREKREAIARAERAREPTPFEREQRWEREEELRGRRPLWAVPLVLVGVFCLLTAAGVLRKASEAGDDLTWYVIPGVLAFAGAAYLVRRMIFPHRRD